MSRTTRRTSNDDNDLDYERDIEINPDYLDAEFLNHAALFLKYSELSAQANKRAKEAEENVKVIRSILVKEANEDPDRYLGRGIKPIAANVEAYYRTHPKHEKAKKEWIEATYEADQLTNIVFAFQARKVALENLVRLHGQEYTAGPREPRDLPEAAARLEEIKAKSTNNRIKERMKRK